MESKKYKYLLAFVLLSLSILLVYDLFFEAEMRQEVTSDRNFPRIYRSILLLIYSFYLVVLKTGVKVAIDKDKKLIVTIRRADLAKDSTDARPEVFSPGNALDAKITELDLKLRKIKLSVKAAQLEEEKSLLKKFGNLKSGATLKNIFETALGTKGKKKKKED